MNREFQNFREASSYAIGLCRKYVISARLERRGEIWIVVLPESLDALEKKLLEQKKQVDYKQKEIEQPRRQTDHEIRLNGWKSYCQTASTLQLSKLWDERRWEDLSEEEEEILRNTLNIRLGINLER